MTRDEYVSQQLKKAIALCERATHLLESAYVEHCKAAGIKP